MTSFLSLKGCLNNVVSFSIFEKYLLQNGTNLIPLYIDLPAYFLKKGGRGGLFLRYLKLFFFTGVTLHGPFLQNSCPVSFSIFGGPKKDRIYSSKSNIRTRIFDFDPSLSDLFEFPSVTSFRSVTICDQF